MLSSVTQKTTFEEFCRLAVADETVFRQFRRQPICKNVVESSGFADGKLYYLEAIRTFNDREISSFVFSDVLGQPEFYQYGEHCCSPTMMRYVKTVSHLVSKCELRDDLHIIEIGGGYGGLCRAIHNIVAPRSYTIYDLPDVIPLQRKFLQSCGIDNVHFEPFVWGKMRGMAGNLTISSYALTECKRVVQEWYLSNAIYDSEHGLINGNYPVDPYNEFDFMTKNEIISALRDCIYHRDAKEFVDASEPKEHTFHIHW